MSDRHTDQIIHIRAEAKTIEDFSYLPGTNNKDRFEQVVALGLKIAEKQIDAPSVPMNDRRAKLDGIMAKFSEPADPVTRSKLADFTDEEIIAYQRTWNRKRSLPAIHMFSQRVAEEEWHV